jgi:hypothetical protein
MRKLLALGLALAIGLWAEVGLTLVANDQVMQCSMSAHEMQAMGNMPCCPGDEMQRPATSMERPECCSVSQAPEQPFGFVVNSERVKASAHDVLAVVSPVIAAPAARNFAVWRSMDTPRFAKPVLELKTDLRI